MENSKIKEPERTEQGGITVPLTRRTRGSPALPTSTK